MLSRIYLFITALKFRTLCGDDVLERLTSNYKNKGKVNVGENFWHEIDE